MTKIKTLLNKYNFIYSFLFLIGCLMLLWVFLIRFLWARLPKNIPFDLTMHGLVSIIFICSIFIIILKHLILPKVSLFQQIFYPFTVYFFRPIIIVDLFIKQQGIIQKFVTRVSGKFINIALKSEDNLYYFYWYLFPRLFLMIVFIFDIFYFCKLNYIYVGLLTNKLIQTIIYICYINALNISYNYMENLQLIANYLQIQERLAGEIELFSYDISAYLQQDKFKQFYGSVDRNTDSFLITSFYKNYIINVDVIMEFLKTLNWFDIYKKYNEQSEIFKYIILEYTDYIVKKEKEYYDNIISPEYIQNIKNETLKNLIAKYQNSKSLSIRYSSLTSSEHIKSFLNSIDWDYYSKTEDCFSNRFEFIYWSYDNYLFTNLTLDFNQIASYDCVNLFTKLASFGKKYVTIEFDSFSLAKSLNKFPVPNILTDNVFLFENNPDAVVIGNIVISDYIITEDIKNLLQQQQEKLLREQRLKQLFIYMYNYTYFEIESKSFSISFFCIKIRFKL